MESEFCRGFARRRFTVQQGLSACHPAHDTASTRRRDFGSSVRRSSQLDGVKEYGGELLSFRRESCYRSEIETLAVRTVFQGEGPKVQPEAGDRRLDFLPTFPELECQTLCRHRKRGIGVPPVTPLLGEVPEDLDLQTRPVFQ